MVRELAGSSRTQSDKPGDIVAISPNCRARPVRAGKLSAALALPRACSRKLGKPSRTSIDPLLLL